MWPSVKISGENCAPGRLTDSTRATERSAAAAGGVGLAVVHSGSVKPVQPVFEQPRC
jgi:hypothetical protein